MSKIMSLLGSLFIFTILLILYFENIGAGLVSYVSVFGMYKSFTSAFFLIVVLSMGLGVLILLYIQRFLRDIEDAQRDGGMSL